MVVFDLIGARAPSGAYYHAGTPHTKALFASAGETAWDEEGVASWYHRMFDDPMVSTDKKSIQSLRSGFRYRSVAESFRMIDDDMEPVVVPWPGTDARSDRVEQILTRLAQREPVGHSNYRVLQDATVSLRSRQLGTAVASGLASIVAPHLFRWSGEYDPLLGVQLDQPAQEDLIW
jgi:hypothetical protein